MKKITNSLILSLITIMGVSLSAACWAQGEENHQGPAVFFVNADSAPGKAVSAFHHALESNDPQSARSLLADEVLIFEGGVERSADEYASHHLLADIKYLGAVTSTLVEHRVQVMGDLAVSISRSKTVGNYQGKEIDNEGLETMVLQQLAGKWKISHIHWSH